MESSTQEAYPSLNTLVRESRMDKKTVIKWKNYLLDTGWLVKTGGTAAEHYSNPSQGAHRVPVVRVDDPTKGIGNSNGKGGGIIPLGEEKEEWNNSTPISPPNVCSCCCSCPCICFKTGIDTTLNLKAESGGAIPSEESSLRSEPEEQKPNQPQEQKQRPSRVESATKWLKTYDSPKPVEFDSWSQVARSGWCIEHKLKALPVPAEEKASDPVETKVPAKVEPQVVLPVEEKPKVPAPPEVKAPVSSASPTPPSSAPPPAKVKSAPPMPIKAWFDPDADLDELDDKPKPYAISPIQCAKCDATFRGGRKGLEAFDQHAFDAHGTPIPRY